MRRVVAWLILLAPASLAAAQVTPTSANADDPRLRTIAYDAGQVVRLEGSPGYQLTVELSPDEQVQNVSLGDTAGWQVSVNKRGDHLFVKAQQSGSTTNLTVLTTVRVYNFELRSLSTPPPDMAYTVRFSYALAELARGASRDTDYVSPRSWYRIRGDAVLRPSFVREDGNKTYVGWPSNRAIPAVFSIDETGQESLIDGMMRDDVMVIDRVVTRLIFRIDRFVARADRLERRRRG